MSSLNIIESLLYNNSCLLYMHNWQNKTYLQNGHRFLDIILRPVCRTNSQLLFPLRPLIIVANGFAFIMLNCKQILMMLKSLHVHHQHSYIWAHTTPLLNTSTPMMLLMNTSTCCTWIQAHLWRYSWIQAHAVHEYKHTYETLLMNTSTCCTWIQAHLWRYSWIQAHAVHKYKHTYDATHEYKHMLYMNTSTHKTPLWNTNTHTTPLFNTSTYTPLLMNTSTHVTPFFNTSTYPTQPMNTSTQVKQCGHVLKGSIVYYRVSPYNIMVTGVFS